MAPTATPGPIVDFTAELRSIAPRPKPEQANVASSTAKPTPTPTPRPKPAPSRKRAAATTSAKTTTSTKSAPKTASRRVSGIATWYCKTGVSVCHHSYPGGMYAAAGSEIRIGNWRGRTVHVCSGGRCIDVRLIDWCACGGSRIIDLYSDAFKRLGPLSAGGLKVTVSW